MERFGNDRLQWSPSIVPRGLARPSEGDGRLWVGRGIAHWGSDHVRFPPGVRPVEGAAGRRGVILLREICEDGSSRRCVRILAASAENVDIATLLQPDMGRPCSGQELFSDLRCVSPSTPPSGEAMAGVLAPYELGSQPYFVKEGMACRVADMLRLPECQQRFSGEEVRYISGMIEDPARFYLRAGYAVAPVAAFTSDERPPILAPSPAPAPTPAPAPPRPDLLLPPSMAAPVEPKGPDFIIRPSGEPKREPDSSILEFPREPETIHR
ncbi:hypothetical protein [Neomegalonema sp.]|uniref:hypothetical protein n=1 Tax=Neomegalonema sp. TaxID=2039713 RepID=UPI00261C83EE|nr:hypothetical protein [Neomegalonema sp.]MDD2869021.1 hypothetical protein [Neomegalonema sp.]